MMAAVRILAIDPATKLGWARNLEADLIVTGKLNLSGSRYDSSAMRYLRFREWLAEASRSGDLLDAGPVDMIVYEEIRSHRQHIRDPKTGKPKTIYGTDAAHFYGGLQAILLTFCEEEGIPCEAIPVGTWKRHLTGRGNANKDLVYECALTYVRNRSPKPETVKLSQDEADAVGLLIAGMRIHGHRKRETG
jgi:hypothetical protein